MNKYKYELHRDLKKYAIFDFSELRLKPYMARVINFFAAISRVFFRPGVDIRRSKTKIKGYKGEEILVTIYEPKDIEENAPCVLYFHGGAFFLQEFSHMHKLVCIYARNVRCKMILVDYRLTPKHPFPVGVEDSYSSLLWAHSHADELGIDTRRIAVMGDSAGGCLAAAVAQMSRDRKGPSICFQSLIYPVLDHSQTTQSIKDFNDAPCWSSNLNRQMWRVYLKNGDHGMLNYASPASAASLSDLPPAYIETPEYDCLRDEGIEYAKRLMDSGIKVELNTIKGTFHGFDIPLYSEVVKAALDARCNTLIEAFTTGE
ncbi:MAG: alpha/beta hydrolase [Clostridiaceae bacterium]|nr:alpha/beta hydrolase [Clostridiaceae bacterium]